MILASSASSFVQKKQQFSQQYNAPKRRHEPSWTNFLCKIDSHTNKAIWICLFRRPLLWKSSNFLKSTAHPKDDLMSQFKSISSAKTDLHEIKRILFLPQVHFCQRLSYQFSYECGSTLKELCSFLCFFCVPKLS